MCVPMSTFDSERVSSCFLSSSEEFSGLLTVTLCVYCNEVNYATMFVCMGV